MKNPRIVGTGPVDDIVVRILKPFGEIVIARDPSEESLLPLLEGAMARIFKSMAEDMAAVLGGSRPRFVVNPEALE